MFTKQHKEGLQKIVLLYTNTIELLKKEEEELDRVSEKIEGCLKVLDDIRAEEEEAIEQIALDIEKTPEEVRSLILRFFMNNI